MRRLDLQNNEAVKQVTVPLPNLRHKMSIVGQSMSTRTENQSTLTCSMLLRRSKVRGSARQNLTELSEYDPRGVCGCSQSVLLSNTVLSILLLVRPMRGRRRMRKFYPSFMHNRYNRYVLFTNLIVNDDPVSRIP